MAFSPSIFLISSFSSFFITFLHIVYFDCDAISASDFVSCIGLNILIFSFLFSFCLRHSLLTPFSFFFSPFLFCFTSRDCFGSSLISKHISLNTNDLLLPLIAFFVTTLYC